MLDQLAKSDDLFNAVYYNNDPNFKPSACAIVHREDLEMFTHCARRCFGHLETRDSTNVPNSANIGAAQPPLVQLWYSCSHTSHTGSAAYVIPYSSVNINTQIIEFDSYLFTVT